MRNVILVLGMHRSGTSAAAGFLVKLGGAQPKALQPADDRNERGYFESYALVTFHEELLASAGSSWTDWRQFNPAWYQSPTATAFQKRAKQLFEEEFDGEPLVVLKDPRVCRFAPFWLEVLAGIKARARVVIPVRAPLEVAFSLRKRDGFSLATGALLWLRHILDAEIASRALPRSIFTWDQLLRDWRSVAEKASTELGLLWPRLSDATAREIENFIGDDLVHHRVSAPELAAHPDIHEWTMSAYRAMLKLARNPQSSSALKTLDKTRDAFNRASRMFGRTVLEDEIRSQDLRRETAKLTDERDHWSRQHDAARAELAGALQAKVQISLELTARAREASERERLAGLASRVAHADAALARERSRSETALARELRQKLAEAHGQREAEERKHAALEQALRRQDAASEAAHQRAIEAAAKITGLEAKTAALAQDVQRREEEVGALLRSTSWKLTAPWRAYKRMMSRLRRLARGKRSNPLFDREWYLRQYRDVRMSELDPYAHYLRHGAAEGRDPNPLFDTDRYLEQNPDVKESGGNPLVQSYLHGAAEGREPGPIFNSVVSGDARDALRQITPKSFVEQAQPAIQNNVSIAREVAKFTSKSTDFEEINTTILSGRRTRAKLLAFYLPQFHSIFENDAWWGKGFTEWTHLMRGLPRFVGHYQPRIPRDFGFYDLRSSDAMRQQVKLARQMGVFGFCFYFYWFNQHRLLDQPLEAFLNDRALDFPLCIVWANENWTRQWDGMDQEVLIRQEYKREDDEALIDTWIRHFSDARYIKLDGRPLLFIYHSAAIPDCSARIDNWRAMFRAKGSVVPWFYMAQTFGTEDPRDWGFDGAIEFPPHKLAAKAGSIKDAVEMVDPDFEGRISSYEEAAALATGERAPNFPLIKTVFPSWDNNARRPAGGHIFAGSTPKIYHDWLCKAVAFATENPICGERIVAVNAWNEWGEAAYLEPDVHYGGAYLNATARALAGSVDISSSEKQKIALIGHDAHPHGAQLLFLAIVELLTRRFGVTCEIVLLEGGPLLPKFEDLAPTTVASNAHELSLAIERLANAGFKQAISNTVVTGLAVGQFKRRGFFVISLVHELPRIIREYKIADRYEALRRETDLIVFPSEFVMAQLAREFGAPHAHAIVKPQGLYSTPDPSRRRRSEVRSELGIPEEAAIVINVGYADHRKGLDLFLSAAEISGGKSKDIFFLWVGAIDRSLQPMIDRALANLTNIRVVGHKSDVYSYLNASDVFFLSSREDPFPSVILEAVAVGLPVIAFDGCGGSVDLIGNDERIGKLVQFANLKAVLENVDKYRTSLNNTDFYVRTNLIKEQYNFAEYVYDLLKLCTPELKKVSVVVPNYSHEPFLLERLKSVLLQKYPIFEILVLDDASLDNSVDEIRRVVSQESRDIDLIVNETNSGSAFRQWARGCGLAKGELVWIAESDDSSDPLFLTEMAASHDAETLFSFCDSMAIGKNGEILSESYRFYYDTLKKGMLSTRERFPSRVFAEDCLSTKNLILNVSSVLWSKKCLQAVLDKNSDDLLRFKMAGDWLLYLEACQRPGNIAYVPTPLNRHRRHSGGITLNLDKNRHLSEITMIHERYRALFGDADGKETMRGAYIAEIHAQFGLGQI